MMEKIPYCEAGQSFITLLTEGQRVSGRSSSRSEKEVLYMSVGGSPNVHRLWASCTSKPWNTMPLRVPRKTKPKQRQRKLSTAT